ncbi:MAG TPA: hypothetical protein VHH88_02160 [Verrucomicrobiae bacterium]|nr:hypothetical protein [Verrucomicrobiae bacterium]
MASPSASAASSTGINAPGGNISINQPNTILWLVVALGLVLGAVVFSKRKK